MNTIHLAPAYLIQGSHDTRLAKAEQMIQSALCLSHAANPEECFCNDCRKIKNNTHPLVIWIKPEKDYTVKDIEVVFEKTHLALEIDQHFFFVLELAHLLTPTTANRLLKIVEEPPTGYHFLFLTNNIRAVLPTIISRCLAIRLTSNEHNFHHPLVSFFTNKMLLDDPIAFELEIKKHHVTKNHAREISDELLLYFQKKIIDEHKQANSDTTYLNNVINHMLIKQKKPAQSGGGTLFLKSLYLTWPRT